MKIKEVYIQEYGPYREWSFQPTTSGVTFIYGPNESGKTSFLESIRYFLFGGKHKKYGHGIGHVTVERDGREYHIGRVGKQLSFFAKGEEPMSVEPGALWWHGLDKKTYDRIFAITLEDLQGTDIVSEVEVRARFFGAEGGERLSTAVKDIEKATGELLVASANGKRKINVLMERLRQLQQQVANLGAQEAEYTRLQQRLDGTEVTEGELRQRYQQWQEYVQGLDGVLRAWDTYKRAEEAKEKMNTLTEATTLEREAFLALDEEISRCREHMRVWRGKEESLIPGSFDPQSPLGVYAQDVEALYQELSKWEQLQKECDQGEAFVRQGKEQLALLRQRQQTWTTEGELPEDINWFEGERLARQLRSACEAYQQWQLREPVCPIENVDKKELQLAKERWEDKEDGWQTLAQAFAETQVAKETLAQRQSEAPSTIGRVTACGVCAGVGVALLIGSRFLQPTMALPALLLGGLLLVIGIIGGGWQWWQGNKQRDGLAALMQQVTDAEKKVADIAVAHGWAAPMSPADMDLIRVSIASEKEAYFSRDVELSKLRSYEDQLATWKVEGDRLTTQGEEALKEWQAWLPMGAKSTLLDGDFFHLKQEYDQYKEQLTAWQGYEKQWKERVDALRVIEEQAATLWKHLELPGPVSTGELRRVYGMLKTRQQQQIRWEQLETQRKNYREEYDNWSKKEKEFLIEQSVLIQKAGLATASEYRQKLLEQDQYKQWETIYKQSQVQIELLAPKGDGAALFFRRLQGTDKAKWQEEYNHGVTEMKSIEQQLNQVYEQRGQLQETMRALSQDQGLANVLQERAQAETALTKALEDWATQVLVSHFMEEAQRAYEKEKQPQALALASQYVEVLTEGSYTLDMGEDAVYVVTPVGTRVPSMQWSSGLADQVYLALRLSLAHAFADRVESLPIILDDILVRFDKQRQKAALQLLSSIAKTQQVIILSCQSSVMEMAKGMDGIQVFELPHRKNK